MMTATLKDILDRAQTWPEEDQQRLVQVALMIEDQQAVDDELTDEDWAIIDASVESAKRGEIATDEEVAALFAKFRPA